MMTCPACGKENEDAAVECRRCRAPLREEAPEAHAPQATASAQDASSEALGTVCSRCEAYNEPGVTRCTSCGHLLRGDPRPPGGEAPVPGQASHPAAGRQPSGARGAPSIAADVTPPDGIDSLSAELRALAITDEEAAQAGLSGNGASAGEALDKTPPQPFVLPTEDPPRAEPSRGRPPEIAAGMAGGVGASSRRPPEPPASPPRAPQPPPAPSEKACASCGARNPPAARFCFECGTAFAKKPVASEPSPVPAAPPGPAKDLPPSTASALPGDKIFAPPETFRAGPLPKAEPRVRTEAPPSIQVSPSIHIDEDLAEPPTAESAPVELDQPLPDEPQPGGLLEEAGSGEPPPEDLPAEEAFQAEPLPEEEAAQAAPDPEAPPPFQASLVLDKGAAAGATFLLAHLENTVGASGTHVELREDPFVAPHAATLVFSDDRISVRDEGSVNGVFVKVREPVPLSPGDLFIVGERLFRYEGPVELARTAEGDTPYQGAPRPQGAAVRVAEVLLAGTTGRTCHRSGPVIAIGRTGCDLNFPGDGLLAARHAEIRLGEDGSASLVDLGAAPAGVFVRIRAQAQHALQAGDLLRVGEQLLRLEVG